MQIKIKALFFTSLILLGLGCLGEEIEELPFGEVDLVITRPGVDIGTVELRAEVRNLDGQSLDEYGFFYTTELSDFEADPVTSGAMSTLYTDPLEGASFDVLITDIDINQVYYFQAYLKQGERVLWSEIRTVAFGVQIGVSPFFEQNNDTLIVRGFINGLNDLPANVKEYGFVYQAGEGLPLPEYWEDSRVIFENLSGDVSFQSILPGLSFNQNYQIRAFLRSEIDSVFYSNNVLELKTGGGWLLMPQEFPNSLVNASVAVIDTVAYIVLGKENDAATDRLRSYSPSLGWGDLPSIGTIGLSNGVAFAIGDLLYITTGVSGAGNMGNNVYSFDTGVGASWQTEESFPAGMSRRQGAVAFVLDEKAYVGTGEDDSGEYLKDFWEFDPSKVPGEQWRQVASMPIQNMMSGPPEYQLGRTEAVVMVIDEKAYVGGGATGLVEHRDFWEFTPPVSESDTGQWVFHSLLPAEGQSQSVSMVVGDRGYMGGGFRSESSFFLQRFWEFDPLASNGTYWTEINSFLGGGTVGGVAFTIGNEGYVGLGQTKIIGGVGGFNNEPIQRIWQFTPTIE